MLINYRLAILLSFFLHLAIVLLSVAQFNHPSTKPVVVVQKKATIINAISVDSSQIEKEVRKIRYERAEKTRLREQEQQAYRAKRIKQQQALKLLKKQQARLEKRNQRAKQKMARQLAALKKRKQLAKKQLAAQAKNIEKERQQLKKINDEIAKKKQLEKKKQRKLLAEKKRKLEQQAKEKREKLEIQQKKARELAAAKAKQQLAIQQAKTATEIAKYKHLITSSISENWIVPPNSNKSLSSRFEIRLSETGDVMSVKLIRSSGDQVLDRSARTAIYKASPLPVPQDKKLFAIFKIVSLTVRPEEVRS